MEKIVFKYFIKTTVLTNIVNSFFFAYYSKSFGINQLENVYYLFLFFFFFIIPTAISVLMFFIVKNNFVLQSEILNLIKSIFILLIINCLLILTWAFLEVYSLGEVLGHYQKEFSDYQPLIILTAVVAPTIELIINRKNF